MFPKHRFCNGSFLVFQLPRFLLADVVDAVLFSYWVNVPSSKLKSVCWHTVHKHLLGLNHCPQHHGRNFAMIPFFSLSSLGSPFRSNNHKIISFFLLNAWHIIIHSFKVSIRWCPLKMIVQRKQICQFAIVPTVRILRLLKCRRKLRHINHRISSGPNVRLSPRL